MWFPFFARNVLFCFILGIRNFFYSIVSSSGSHQIYCEYCLKNDIINTTIEIESDFSHRNNDIIMSYVLNQEPTIQLFTEMNLNNMLNQSFNQL